MSIFDTLIVQPIFNLLILLYAIIPGGDFGVTIIVFTIIIRLLMWPLVKKQLHQTKVMRQMQPELKKIKAKAKGNKQLEAQMMMELYRERGVSPFGSIGLLLIQLPIFIALFHVIQIMTIHRDEIEKFTYNFLEGLQPIATLIKDPDNFNESLLGVVDLTKHAVSNEGVYIPLLILALLASALQYFQSKQITPQPTENKRLRDIMKESADGKQADQSEISAIMSQRMIKIFPIITFFVAIYLPGALVLYYAATSGVAIIQQRMVLGKDVEEMEDMADAKNPRVSSAKSAQTTKRVKEAQEAEVVPTSGTEPAPSDKQAAKASPTPKPKTTGKRKRRKR